MKDKIVYAEIDHISDQMKNNTDIVIMSDGALFLACRKVVSNRYDLAFFPIDTKAEQAYILFRKGTTNLISDSLYAFDHSH